MIGDQAADLVPPAGFEPATHGLGSVDTAGSRGALIWLDLRHHAGGHVQELTVVDPRLPCQRARNGHGDRGIMRSSWLPRTTCTDCGLAAESALDISHRCPAIRRPLAD